MTDTNETVSAEKAPWVQPPNPETVTFELTAHQRKMHKRPDGAGF